MASDESFIKYVIDQFETSSTITYKKMFGEYLIYANQKPVVMVCDNIAFVKMLDCIKPLMENADKGFPYEGAKEHYVLDIEDRALVAEVVKTLEANTPLPKSKKRK